MLYVIAFSMIGVGAVLVVLALWGKSLHNPHSRGRIGDGWVFPALVLIVAGFIVANAKNESDHPYPKDKNGNSYSISPSPLNSASEACPVWKPQC